jgi:hypothetical protein
MRLTIIILFVVTNFFSQKNWSFGLQQGTIVQQKFNPIFESILQENYKETFTFTRDLYFKRNVEFNDKHSISIGFTFLKRKLRIKNYIDTVLLRGETTGGGGSAGPTYNIPLKKVALTMDRVLVCTSEGITLGYEHKFFTSKKTALSIGLNSSNYIFNRSRNKMTLTSKNRDFGDEKYQDKYLVPAAPKFTPFVSFSSNLEIYSKFMYNNTIGIRVAFGTSLRSNWDNFANYYWLGTGIEYSFGEKKVKAVKDV